MVRESSWYALGLLLRDEPGDRQRAADILDAVLKQQYLTPGTPWYGTFRRAPEEQEPAPDAVMWRNFDPNWRIFIGTTFEMILIEYPDRISPELAQRMYKAIDRGIEGEIAEKRLLPSYSNIALMYGALWDFAAAHDKRADWQQQSSEWTESVYKLYKQYGAFFEYNSPTYCGVDLYGLALWRSYGSTPRMRAIGSEMEAGLVAEHRRSLSARSAQCLGPLRPRLRHGHGELCERRRRLDADGFGREERALAGTSRQPPIICPTSGLRPIWRFSARVFQPTRSRR